MLAEIRADFDRLRNQIDASRALPADCSDEAASMVNAYLCVAIAGRLEQNLKQILIQHSERSSEKKMSRAISRLCQSFQNPSKEKICELVKLFDNEFSEQLHEDWKGEGNPGSIISDMIGKRKNIAHQTTNRLDVTKTKIDAFYGAYKDVETRVHNHFLS